VRRLERALAVLDQSSTAIASKIEAVATRARVRFELARALVATGSDRGRALALAREAEQELVRAAPGASGARDLERVRGWLRRFRSSTR
jgi:hypothetical protein